jgi:alkylmercury lyase-like protein
MRYHKGRRAAPASDTTLEQEDNRLRTLLTQFIAQHAREPTIDQLVGLSGRDARAVRKGLARLEAKRGLLLHPHARRPWIVHPFSLSPAACWVQGRDKSWWAACLYCAFGVAGCVGEDVVITTRLGGEAAPADYRIAGGVLQPTADLFHFATPPKRWWDNVVHTCATFQPFRTEADVVDWCDRHGYARGFILPVARLFAFALDWYRPHATKWRQRSSAEIRACFSRHGLQGPFWRV